MADQFKKKRPQGDEPNRDRTSDADTPGGPEHSADNPPELDSPAPSYVRNPGSQSGRGGSPLPVGDTERPDEVEEPARSYVDRPDSSQTSKKGEHKGSNPPDKFRENWNDPHGKPHRGVRYPGN